MCKRELTHLTAVKTLLTSEKLDVRRVPTMPKAGKGSSLCPNFVQTVEFVLSFWGSRILEHVRLRLPDPSPIKTLGPESLRSFSGRPHFTCVVTSHCWVN